MSLYKIKKTYISGGGLKGFTNAMVMWFVVEIRQPQYFESKYVIVIFIVIILASPTGWVKITHPLVVNPSVHSPGQLYIPLGLCALGRRLEKEKHCGRSDHN